MKDDEIQIDANYTLPPPLREANRTEILKMLRVDCDYLTKKITHVLGKTPYTMLATRAAQGAKHFLGKVMKFCGIPTPYTNSSDPSNTKVEPTADVYLGDLPKTCGDRILDIKELRKQIGEMLSRVEAKNIDEYNHVVEEPNPFKYRQLAWDTAWERMNEINHWLGEEIQEEEQARLAAQERATADSEQYKGGLDLPK